MFYLSIVSAGMGTCAGAIVASADSPCATTILAPADGKIAILEVFAPRVGNNDGIAQGGECRHVGDKSLIAVGNDGIGASGIRSGSSQSSEFVAVNSSSCQHRFTLHDSISGFSAIIVGPANDSRGGGDAFRIHSHIAGSQAGRSLKHTQGVVVSMPPSAFGARVVGGIPVGVTIVIEGGEIRVSSVDTHAIVTCSLGSRNGDVGFKCTSTSGGFTYINDLTVLKRQAVVEVHPDNEGVRIAASGSGDGDS